MGIYGSMCCSGSVVPRSELVALESTLELNFTKPVVVCALSRIISETS